MWKDLSSPELCASTIKASFAFVMLMKGYLLDNRALSTTPPLASKPVMGTKHPK